LIGDTDWYLLLLCWTAVHIAGFEDNLHPAKIVDLCYRLAFAAELVVSPSADADTIIARLESTHDSSCSSLERSLTQSGENGMVNKQG